MSQDQVRGGMALSQRSAGFKVQSLPVAQSDVPTTSMAEATPTRTAYPCTKGHSAQRELSREFATLLGVGIPPVDGLLMLRDKTSCRPQTHAIEAAISMIQCGFPLAIALRAQPGAFDPHFVTVVESRERTGEFERALFEYAAYLDWSDALAAGL